MEKIKYEDYKVRFIEESKDDVDVQALEELVDPKDAKQEEQKKSPDKNMTKKKTETKKEMIDTCAVCICEYTSDETLILTNCQHLYHEKCLVQWITHKLDVERLGNIYSPICPSCRAIFNIKRSLIRNVAPIAQQDEPNENSAPVPDESNQQQSIDALAPQAE